MPVGRLLRGASAELAQMGEVVLSLERLVCDLLAHDPDLAAARGRELQAVDLLAQRLRGLGGCLAALADPLDAAPPAARLPLEAALPLAAQRAALLGEPGARADSALELF